MRIIHRFGRWCLAHPPMAAVVSIAIWLTIMLYWHCSLTGSIQWTRDTEGVELPWLAHAAAVTYLSRLFWRFGCQFGCQTLNTRHISSHLNLAGVAKLADAADLKSADRKVLWVRAPLPAPII